MGIIDTFVIDLQATNVQNGMTFTVPSLKNCDIIKYIKVKQLSYIESKDNTYLGTIDIITDMISSADRKIATLAMTGAAGAAGTLDVSYNIYLNNTIPINSPIRGTYNFTLKGNSSGALTNLTIATFAASLFIECYD